MEKVTFEQVVEKVGLGEAFGIFHDKLSEEKIGSFAYSDWVGIYNSLMMEIMIGKKDDLYAIVVGNMVKKSESIEEILESYSHTKDESKEEKMALQKLTNFQPKEWLEVFGKKGRISIGEKGKKFLFEKMRDSVVFS